MGAEEKNEDVLRQALRDANCDEDTMQKFLRLREAGQKEEALRTLTCHRCHLVRAMHDAQKPVDVLDYLIYQLKKEK